MPRPTAVGTCTPTGVALLALSLASASAGTRAHAGASVVVRVDATQPTHTVNPLYMGCHSDSGFGQQVRSFYSNLLYGESFEPGASTQRVHVVLRLALGVWPSGLAAWDCSCRAHTPTRPVLRVCPRTIP